MNTTKNTTPERAFSKYELLVTIQRIALGCTALICSTIIAVAAENPWETPSAFMWLCFGAVQFWLGKSTK